MSARLLVYGANGYTGRLICREAVDRGLRPILAGRNGPAVSELARSHGLEHRVFGLDVPSTVDACLESVDVVLNCAGPFAQTAAAMAMACARTRTHYLDVTGEVAVFEQLAKASSEAAMADVMWMPGVGFDVVPSDCLARYVSDRGGAGLPGRTLRLAILSDGLYSRGTAVTAVGSLHRALVRRNGALVPIRAGALRRSFDFGRGLREAIAVPLGDLVSAQWSTGIADIETYLAASPSLRWGARAAGLLPWLLGARPLQGLLRRRMEKQPAGPSDEQRQLSTATLVAEVDGPLGVVRARLSTPNGYTLTAFAAVEIARRALAGETKPGFRTPSEVYGADFVLSLPGVRREDG